MRDNGAMTSAAYARLYKIIAGFCLLLSLSVHLLTQGGGSLAELPGLDGGQPVISAYFVVMVTGLLLFLAGVLAVLHLQALLAERNDGSTLVAALPLVGLGETAEDVDPAHKSTRRYSVIVFVLFAVFPTISLVHLARVVADRGIIWSLDDATVPVARAVCVMGVNWPLVGACPPDERASASQMKGRLGLAENACDVAWFRAGGAPPTGQCLGPRDRSVACEHSLRRCSGVDWLPRVSPALLFSFTLAGILGFISQGLLLFDRGRAALRRVKLL